MWLETSRISQAGSQIKPILYLNLLPHPLQGVVGVVVAEVLLALVPALAPAALVPVPVVDDNQDGHWKFPRNPTRAGETDLLA
jgi:hypothetical protein